jgi:hypothetical protein
MSDVPIVGLHGNPDSVSSIGRICWRTQYGLNQRFKEEDRPGRGPYRRWQVPVHQNDHWHPIYHRRTWAGFKYVAPVSESFSITDKEQRRQRWPHTTLIMKAIHSAW